MKRFGLVFLVIVLSGCPLRKDGAAPHTDQYPGDDAYTRIVQRLQRDIQADRIRLPWVDGRVRTRMDVCDNLVDRHFDGGVGNPVRSNAQFLGCEGLTRDALKQACKGALAAGAGFASGDNWRRWSGSHAGRWQQDGQAAGQDNATWDAPGKERSRVPGDTNPDGSPREYDFQRVRWDNRSGWNQSHPDVPYVWGWDPKNNGNENGEIGTHIGFPFAVSDCEFIVWFTPKEAFLEGIRPGAPDRPKTSAGYKGRGQWNIR